MSFEQNTQFFCNDKEATEDKTNNFPKESEN